MSKKWPILEITGLIQLPLKTMGIFSLKSVEAGSDLMRWYVRMPVVRVKAEKG